MKFLSTFIKRLKSHDCDRESIKYATLLKKRLHTKYYLNEHLAYASNLNEYFLKYPLETAKVTNYPLSLSEKAQLVGVLNHTRAEIRLYSIVVKEIENWLKHV
jgi:hypothetical protein